MRDESTQLPLLVIEKRCSKCGEVKPRHAFGKERRRHDGLQAYCSQCHRERHREWTKANSERVNQYNRSYRRKRPDFYQRINERSALWAKAHPEKRRQSRRKWKQSNKEKVCGYEQKRQAIKAQSVAELVDFAELLAIHGRICHICGQAIGDDLHFDHIIPLSRGGKHIKDNIAPAHASCNLRKGATLPDTAFAASEES